MLPKAGVRGVAVRLSDSMRSMLDRPEYNDSIRALLGETAAASVMLTGHVKVDGRLSVHLKTDGELRALFAECTAAGTIRGIAQIAEDRSAPPARDLSMIGNERHLAITIENRGLGGRDPHRYQGLVEVVDSAISQSLERYFDQSEQLPTRILLAANDESAAGLMIQKLPGDQSSDEDGWNRASALFDTLTEHELLKLDSTSVLHRLFHEEEAEILGTKAIQFACSCSRARATEMLRSLGPDPSVPASSAATTVKCEFCGQNYDFSEAEMADIYAADQTEQPAPSHLQ